MRSRTLPRWHRRGAALALPLLALVSAAPRTEAGFARQDSTQEEADLGAARRARSALQATDPKLGLYLRSRYVFLGSKQSTETVLFLSADGQLSQTLSAGSFGSQQQVLGREAAWAERSTPDAEGRLVPTGGDLDATGVELLRARALIYWAALRFPWFGAEEVLERDVPADSPELFAWKLHRGSWIARIFCKRETSLPQRIEVPATGLSLECEDWGPAPRSTWPDGAEVPRRWRWSQGDPYPGPEVREEIEELQFDVTCPPDLLAAHRGGEPGRKVSLDPLRASRASERWGVRVEMPLAPGETFQVSASGFAHLLQRLRDLEVEPLDAGSLHPPVLAWETERGRWAILEAAGDRPPLLRSGAEGLVVHIADPLGAASQLGIEMRDAPEPYLLWAPAEELGPESLRYLSLRVATVR